MKVVWYDLVQAEKRIYQIEKSGAIPRSSVVYSHFPGGSAEGSVPLELSWTDNGGVQLPHRVRILPETHKEIVRRLDWWSKWVSGLEVSVAPQDHNPFGCRPQRSASEHRSRQEESKDFLRGDSPAQDRPDASCVSRSCTTMIIQNSPTKNLKFEELQHELYIKKLREARGKGLALTQALHYQLWEKAGMEALPETRVPDSGSNRRSSRVTSSPNKI